MAERREGRSKKGGEKKLDFRQKAERIHNARKPDDNVTVLDKDKLQHELEVHQIELEIQDEELRRAQQELQESQSRYVDLFDFAPVGYFLLDSHYLIVEANLTGCRMLGLERKRVVGQRFTRFITPISQDVFYHCLTIEKRSPERKCELEMNRVKIGPFYAELRIVAINSADNEPHYRVAVIDINERKLIEEGFKETQELSRTGSWQYDFDQQAITWSDEVYVLYERNPRLGPPTPEEDASYYSPEEYQALRDFVTRAIETGQTIKGDLNVRLPSRKPAVYHFTFHPLKDAQGRVVKLNGVVQDITEPKRIEEMLRQNEERYRNLVETTSDFIWEVNKDGVFIYASPKVYDILGYRAEEIIGKTPFDLMLPEESESIRKKFQKYVSRKSPINSLENINRHKDGHPVILETSGVPVYNSDGSFQGYRGIDRNITRRKKAEEALVRAKEELETRVQERTRELKESEEKYRNVVDNANEVIVVVQDGIVKFSGGKALEFTGYSPEDLLSKPFLDFIYPDDRKLTVERNRRRMLGEAVPGNFEFRILRKDGSVAWGQSNSTKITWENRPATLSFLINITERKQAEEAFRESQKKYQALVETTSDFIWEIDAQGRYTYCSPQMKTLWGYNPQEWVGKTPFDAMLPGEREQGIKAFSAMAQSQRSFSGIEFSSLDSQGRLITIEISGVPYFDTEGKFSGFRGISRDVTERKKAEEALKQSEEKYRLVVENASEAIVIAQDGMLQYFNPRLLEITGYSAEDLKSKPFLDFVYPEDRKHVAEIYRKRIMGEAAPESYEYRVIIKGGNIRWMRMNATLVTWEGRPATLNIFTDITEEKNLRDQLIEYAHRIVMVQEEERKRIAYELHDDTAQYLSIIKMQLDALLHSGKIQNPEITAKLQYLEKDANQAFNDVRRYSHELRPVILERSGLTAALEQIAEDYNRLGQLPVKMKVAGTEPELSEEMKLGLFRIVQEALNNSRKHSKARDANIILNFRENQLEVAVSDNGQGFDVKEAAPRARGKGSLGLMSMQERAKTIGADLNIESAPGKGTRVRVSVKI